MQVNNYKAYLQLEKNLKQFQGLNIGFVFCTVIIFSAGFILSMLLISLDGTNLLTVKSNASNIKYLSIYFQDFYFVINKYLGSVFFFSIAFLTCLKLLSFYFRVAFFYIGIFLIGISSGILSFDIIIPYQGSIALILFSVIINIIPIVKLSIRDLCSYSGSESNIYLERIYEWSFLFAFLRLNYNTILRFNSDKFDIYSFWAGLMVLVIIPNLILLILNLYPIYAKLYRVIIRTLKLISTTILHFLPLYYLLKFYKSVRSGLIWSKITTKISLTITNVFDDPISSLKLAGIILIPIFFVVLAATTGALDSYRQELFKYFIRGILAILSLIILSIYRLSYIKMQNYRLNFNYLIDSPLHNLEQLPPDQKQAYSKIIDSIVRRFNNLDFQTYDKAYSVIIDGHWGVGKSTLKNLIVNKLFNYKNHPGQMAKWGEHLFFWTQNYSKTSDDNFVWVEFNPWILGTSEDIILDFFKLLNTTLKKHYGSGLDVNLKQFVSSISPTLTGLSQYTGFEFNFGGLARADSANHTFERLKERLSNIPQKIIISIDDIDRMEPETILTVIKLISITGNLPNLIFVLTLDYTIIEPILKEKLGDRYAHYLEKIIQAKYIVPLLTFDDKCYIITECLKQHYGWGSDNVSKVIDQVKNIVDKYPQSNPRQIKRLAFEVIHHCDLNSNMDKMEVFLDLDSKEFIQNYLDKQIHPTPLP